MYAYACLYLMYLFFWLTYVRDLQVEFDRWYQFLQALMGWHVRDELETLESYSVAANVRSSSLMKVCIGSSSLMI